MKTSSRPGRYLPILFFLFRLWGEGKTGSTFQKAFMSPTLLGTLISDVVSHVPYRTFRLTADDGVVEWDWNAAQVCVFKRADGKWRIMPEGHGFRGFSNEQTYLFEIEQSVKAVRGDVKWEYTLEDDARVLAVLSAIGTCRAPSGWRARLAA